MSTKVSEDGETFNSDEVIINVFDNTANALKVLPVNSSGVAQKILPLDKTTTGASCTGSDGASNRVLTLSNTSTSANELVVVNRQVLVVAVDYTVSHKSASSTVTFLNAVFDTDNIFVRVNV